MFKSKVLRLFRKTFGPSVTAAPPRPKPHPTFRPELEGLEDRELLNGDVLIWNPTDGTSLASHPANWFDQSANNGLGQQGVEAAGIGSGVGCQVQFSSAKSTAAITWDEGATVGNILLTGGGGAGGGGGYNSQQTINAGVTVASSNGIGMSGTNSMLKVNFLDSQSELESLGGINTWTNFLFTGLGTLVVYGGQVTIASNTNYVESFDTNVIVGNGAIMTDPGQSSVNFGNQNSNLFFRINSQSSFGLSSGAVGQLITSNTQGDYFDVNGGTLGYNGQAGTESTIASAILVENSGVFSVNGGGGDRRYAGSRWKIH